jgi:hypothetical protein
MKLRFSIRDLMWLTLVVALSVGWWIEHREQAEFDEYYPLLKRESELQRRRVDELLGELGLPKPEEKTPLSLP